MQKNVLIKDRNNDRYKLLMEYNNEKPIFIRITLNKLSHAPINFIQKEIIEYVGHISSFFDIDKEKLLKISMPTNNIEELDINKIKEDIISNFNFSQRKTKKSFFNFFKKEINQEKLNPETVANYIYKTYKNNIGYNLVPIQFNNELRGNVLIIYDVKIEDHFMNLGLFPIILANLIEFCQINFIFAAYVKNESFFSHLGFSKTDLKDLNISIPVQGPYYVANQKIVKNIKLKYLKN